MSRAGDAIVVGSGPNGLAAAITLASHGRDVTVFEAADTPGGGLRSEELFEPGTIHDICSAVHPLGVASPFLKSLPLAELGARFVHPEVALSHPLDGGAAAVGLRSLDDTVAALGNAGRGYRRLIGPLVERWDDLLDDVLGPLLDMPEHPLTLGRFGLRAVPSASLLAKRLRSDESRALLAGAAAHAIVPLGRPLTGAVAAMFLASIHGAGWPVVEGGSARLADALVRHLESLGGRLITGTRVTDIEQLPAAEMVLFDLTPRQVARIAGSRLPDRFRHAFEEFPNGPGVFKVDYLLGEPVPWADPHSPLAGTVHLGGTIDEIATAEADVAAGRHPEAPFVLVAQQDACDPTRSRSAHRTLWAYCHVPNGSTVDMTEAMETQIERFAPGFRDTVVARRTMGPADLQRYNPNYIGGDIAGGSMAGLRAVFRPRIALHPYRTPDPGIFICSSSTPPGAGVHGMCGHLAALDALDRSTSGPPQR